MLNMADRTDSNERRRLAGAWLAEARHKAGLTQRELELAANLGAGNASNYETGKSGVPDDAAARIANALGIGVIEARRGLGLWVPDDMADGPQAEVDIVALIRRDPHLLPEARRHFENQYKLLRRLGEPGDGSRVTSEEPLRPEILDLPHAARKRRTPRKPT